MLALNERVLCSVICCKPVMNSEGYKLRAMCSTTRTHAHIRTLKMKFKWSETLEGIWYNHRQWWKVTKEPLHLLNYCSEVLLRKYFHFLLLFSSTLPNVVLCLFYMYLPTLVSYLAGSDQYILD